MQLADATDVPRAPQPPQPRAGRRVARAKEQCHLGGEHEAVLGREGQQGPIGVSELDASRT
jgi:hypothetical protein